MACGAGDGTLGGDGGLAPNADAARLPSPACKAAEGGGRSEVAAPARLATLFDRWHENWLGSPAVADLDGDGVNEIIAARHGLLLGWHLDGEIVLRVEVQGRIWSSPVVADLVPSRPGLEVGFAARGEIHVVDSTGSELPGFPFAASDELRSLAAGDIDGDGRLELVAVTTNPIMSAGQRDIIFAVNDDGSPVAGFPANTSGASGCDDACYVTGGYDQNIALGDVDGDLRADVFATQDNAYLSLHDGTGRAFDSAPIFSGRSKFLGIRFLHDYGLAQQGWANDEATANQAHFTNSAPAIADIDGDGVAELVVLASVQNAAQTDRERGVALWVVKPDGTRPPAFVEPHHVSGYLSGLWDFDGTNIVAATNQVAVGEIYADRPGPEFVFAGFDGAIHAVDSAGQRIWDTVYTTDPRVLTTGVALADLSGDGRAEVVFATYSPDVDKGALIILDAAGNRLHQLPLGQRGSMAVPTIADVDLDGALEIVVALKDGEDGLSQVVVYRVEGSAPNCLLWATGRGNLRRDGYVPPVLE